MLSAERGVVWAGLGHHVPERVVGNDEIEADMGLPPGWIERRTGIRTRHYAAPDEALSNIARPAGEMALRAAGIDRRAVGLLLLATSTPDHLLPPTAPLLAHQLGLACGGVDLAGACAGFLYALTLGAHHCKLTGQAVLVIGANILSRRINPAEAASRVLFADAAGAMLLVPAPDPGLGLVASDLGGDGSAYGMIGIRAGGSREPWGLDTPPDALRMAMPNGKAVYAAAVEGMVRSGERALASAGLTARDITHWAPHQANLRIVEAVRDRLGLSAARLLGSLDRYGNSSAATIPLSLSLAASAGQGVRPGETTLLSAFGAGTLWASVVWR